MMRQKKVTSHKSQVAYVLFISFFLFAFWPTPKAHSAELLWEIKVPIQLIAMTGEVKYVVIKWGIMEGFNVLFQKEEVIPVQLDAHIGNFTTTLTLTVYDTDLKDPSKANNFFIKMELSEDGVTSYKPNTPGKPWTKSKPGSKLTKQYVLGDLQKGPPYHKELAS